SPSSPKMAILPALGCSNPAIRRRQVVLPEPDGPSMAKNSPGAMSRSTPSTARTAPKWRYTPRKETATGPPALIAPTPPPCRLSSLPADDGDVVARPARIGHAGLLGGAFSDRRLPERDLVEVVVTVGGAARIAEKLVA